MGKVDFYSDIDLDAEVGVFHKVDNIDIMSQLLIRVTCSLQLTDITYVRGLNWFWKRALFCSNVINKLGRS